MVKFDHLILLMGTNPLPNFVVARYFLDHNPELRTIRAAYTKETEIIARRLEGVLYKLYPKERFSFHDCYISNPGDASVIRHAIEEYAIGEERQNGKFHLNYTGGTKVMGIHAYRSAFPLVATDQMSFSYLDAHNFTLKVEGDSPIEDLRRQIGITFPDLLELHGCKIFKEKPGIDWSQPNEFVCRWVKENKISDFLLWRKKAVLPWFYDGKHDFLEKPQVTRIQLFPDLPGLASFNVEAADFLQSFPEPFKWEFDATGNLVLPESDKARKKWREGAVKYIDGIWLEYYASKIIQEECRGLFEIHCNKFIIRERASKEFEIDILALYGYQLCGISVTTADIRYYQKSKAFEILHRSAQMGGDEARSVLLSVMEPDKVFELKQDLEVDTGNIEALLVLGKNDLAPEIMWRKIKQHILGD